MSEIKDIYGYCNNPLCINYLLTSTYPEGFCEICDRLITRTNGLTMTEELDVPKAAMKQPRKKICHIYHVKRLFTDEQLRELHAQGLNDVEIADKLGVSKNTVRNHRKRLGLKGYRTRRLFTDQQLIELHEKGLNDVEIGEKLGANDQTVFNHRKRLGLKANKNRPLIRRFTDQQLIELYEQGLYDREIAEKLDVPLHTVAYHRRRLGLKGYSPGRRFTDQQLIELYKQGLIDREIGEKFGIDKSTVGRHRRRIGLKAHGYRRSYRRMFTDEQLIALHEEGLNDREKGERLGVSTQVVFYHRRRLGLKSHGRHYQKRETVQRKLTSPSSRARV